MNQSPHRLDVLCSAFVQFLFFCFSIGHLYRVAFCSSLSSRTRQNILTKTVTTKFAQRHNRNGFCKLTLVDTVFKVQAKKCCSFSFFGCSFRGTHSYVLFYFRVGHIFYIRNSKLKTVLFFGSSFRWTHFCVLFYFPVGHIF